MSSFELVLVNNLATEATLFFRATAVAFVSLSPSLSSADNLIGDPYHDCSGALTTTTAAVPCAPPPLTTLHFTVDPGVRVNLYFRSTPPFSSAEIWASSTTTTMTSPTRLSFVRVKFSSPRRMRFSATFEEAVSCGIKMRYSGGGTAAAAVVDAMPADPSNRGYDNTVAVVSSVVPSTKYTEQSSPLNKLLAQCPSEVVSKSACSQHQCRVYYARQLASGTSYCNWIRDDCGGNAYCWALDQLICRDVSCGYASPETTTATAPRQLANGGLGTTFGDACDVPNEVDQSDHGLAPLWSAVDYSCGGAVNLPRSGSSGGPWWPTQTGCTPNTSAVTSVELPSSGGSGALTISFENLSWLSRRETTVTVATRRYGGSPPSTRTTTTSSSSSQWVSVAALIVFVAVALFAVLRVQKQGNGGTRLVRLAY